MPKIPYKADKLGENDDDYEIVSFEDFCDKSPGSKTDLLTLNDNINYRLCFEGDKKLKYQGEVGESSRDVDLHTETSLSGPKNGGYKRRMSNSFAPFGKYCGKGGRAPLFSGVIPRPREDEDTAPATREHRYQRFSDRRGWLRRVWERVPGAGSGAMGIALVCAVCVAAWWAVSGVLGSAWADDHYRKLWERAHPETANAPVIINPIQIEKPTEHRYHDHNNLSTKNRSNSTDFKKTSHKKNDRTPEQLREVCAKIDDNMRFDCYPEGGASEPECQKRGCCWYASTNQKAPYCFYPPQYTNYKFLNMTEDKHSLFAFYELVRPSGYPNDFNVVRMDVKYLSDDSLQVKISDAEHRRFEPPYPEMSTVPKTLTKPHYRVEVEGSMPGFKVIRNDDNVTIFNTQDAGALILSDKFLQISALLSTDHIYGLGEKRARFMHDMNWQTFAIFNRDRQPLEGLNVYGSHPFYLGVEPKGQSHGTLLLNANAMDIALQPTPAITYRAIGGILDFYIFVSPTPKGVISQYTELIGRPFMPPYWALGFHLCKFNYGSLNETKRVWQTNRDAGIPFDVQWNDIDYMHDHNDFTYDVDKYKGLPEFVKQLHNAGMHYVVIIDPGVGASEKAGTYPPYDRGLEMDVFVKNSTNQPFVGKVWNTGLTVFPDFTHPNSTPYWLEMMTDFHKLVPYDGAWIDMNEPSNFPDGSVYGRCLPENLPYSPHTRDASLHTHTLCMEARHYAGAHYDWHNLYALTEAVATNFALLEIRGKRPFIISRASFVGLGAYAGHWSGDINSAWHDMRMTIPELLTFSLFGVPMMGADICGFQGNATPELCKRWMQLGAFYPFSRNHNSDESTAQDPASLGAGVLQASRTALRLRYRLLPHYYTLFWRAHLYGETVARPLFFEWPEQWNLHDIDDQFLIGPYLMVTPILDEGAVTTKAFYPAPQTWYALTGHALAEGQWLDVDEHSTVSVRGGAVIPMQEPPLGVVTTTVTRSRPLQLVVVPDSARAAHGDLYWDDGDSINSYQEGKYSHIEFYLNQTEFRTAVRWWGYGVPTINKLSFFDQQPIKSVNINNQTCTKPCEYSYDRLTNVLYVSVNLSLDIPFTVSWTYKPKTVYKNGAVMASHG